MQIARPMKETITTFKNRSADNILGGGGGDFPGI